MTAIRLSLFSLGVFLATASLTVPLTLRNKLVSSSVVELIPRTDTTTPWAGNLTNSNNFIYTGWVTLGTPPQAFQLQFDTGSSFTWVAQENCNGCNSQNFFDQVASDTYVSAGSFIQLNYGQGDCSGIISTDVVGLGEDPYTFASGQFFVLISSAEDFAEGMDGILGLAFSSLSSEYPTFVDNLVATGNIDARVFSVFLSTTSADGSDDQSRIIFGSLPFNYNNTKTLAVTDSGYWSVRMTNAKVGGTSINTHCQYAIVDTGTSLLIIGTHEYDKVVKKITKGFSQCDYSSGLPACVCDSKSSFPNIYIDLDGETFSISPDVYILEVPATYNGKNVVACLVLIQSGDVTITADGGSAWILGDVFIREYYIQFDMDNQQMKLSKHIDDGGNSDSSDSSASSSFPGWAIAVIVIVIFVVLVAAVVAVYCFIRRRRKNQGGYALAGQPSPAYRPMDAYQPPQSLAPQQAGTYTQGVYPSAPQQPGLYPPLR